MPLFEFACRSCAHEFEFLVRDATAPTCPACRGSDLVRRFSVFAAHTNGTSTATPVAASPCGACGDPRGPGACSLN